MFEPPQNPSKGSAFPATDWALVLAAGTEPGAHEATVRIFELYWEPIYNFIRRTWPSKSADEALDATHDFFKLRLEAHDIRDLDPKRGKFQNWLQGKVKYFLSKRIGQVNVNANSSHSMRVLPKKHGHCSREPRSIPVCFSSKSLR